MNPSDSHDDLMFGLLAVQFGFVTKGDLESAVKKRPDGVSLAAWLVQQSLISIPNQNYINRILADQPETLASSTNPAAPGQLLDRILSALEHASQNTNSAEGPTDVAPTMSFGQSNDHGRFHVLRPHAKGGLGEVLVAQDGELNREVALKRIQYWHADNPESRSRFSLEAEVTGSLEHPGIVPVYGMGTDDDGRPYYAMRLIKGESLKNAIKSFHQQKSGLRTGERSVRFRKLLGHFVDACNAIAYAHSRGVLHRDVKPANIMLGKYGETLVVDWGLAKIVGDDSHDSDISDETLLRPSSGSSIAKTQLGSAVGTLAYMSPEQASGRIDRLAPRSDVYSLGATLYHVLTGQPPFDTDDTSLIPKIKRGEFPSPRSVSPRVPKGLASICKKAMSVHRSDRYPSADRLAVDIENWLADEPNSAHKDSLFESLSRLYRRHRVAVFVGTSLLLASSVVLGIMNGYLGAANRHVTQETTRAQTNLASARALALDLLDFAEVKLSSDPNSIDDRQRITDEVLQQFETFLEQAPDDSEVMHQMAKVLRIRANLSLRTFDIDKAAPSFTRAIRLLEDANVKEGSREAQNDLVLTLVDYSTMLTSITDNASAIATLESASDKLASMDQDEPIKSELLKARIQQKLAELYLSQNANHEVIELATSAHNTLRKYLDHKNQFNVQLALIGRTAMTLAAAHEQNGNREEAIRLLRENNALTADRIDQDPNVNNQAMMYRSITQLATLQLQNNPTDPDARESLDAVIPELSRLAVEFPIYGFYRVQRDVALAERAFHELSSGKSQTAETEAKEAYESHQPFAEKMKVPKYTYRVGRLAEVLVLCLLQNGKTKEAASVVEAAQRSLATLENDPTALKWHRRLGKLMPTHSAD